MARISFIGDDGDALEIVVGPDNPEVLVGRHRTCAIRTSTQSVSRQHARIFYDGERYWLQDNGSSNGTYYKNERLEPQASVEVEDGEFFMCGNFEMRFDLDDEDLRAHARRAGGAVSDTLDEYDAFSPPGGYAEADDATRFASPADEWSNDQAPPPVPMPPPPPPAYVAPPAYAPPLPPAAVQRPVDPPPAQRYAASGHAAAPPPPSPPSPPAPGRGDAAVVEELRAALESRTRDLADREKRLQNMEIELESLGRRLADSNDEARMRAMQMDLERLLAAEVTWSETGSQLVSAEAQIARLREELELANGEAEANRQDIAELQSDCDDLRREADTNAAEVGRLRVALAAAEAVAMQAGASAEAQATIDAFEDEIGTLKDDIRHLEEKYEEARAGRRNAEQLADLLRAQSDTFRAGSDALRQELVQAKAMSGGAGALALVESARVAAEARVLELTALLSSRADTGPARPDPKLVAERDQALEDLEDAEHRIVRLERQVADLQSVATAATPSSDAALVESLRAALTNSQARVAAAEAAAAAARAAIPAVNAAPVVDAAALHREIETLRTDRDDLEAAASANMKRIKKLLEDLEAARAAGAAQTRAATEDPRVQALAAEVAGLHTQLGQARDALQSAASVAASGPTGGPDLTDIRKIVADLNGVVSSFRSDFMSITDSFDAARSDEPDEAAEAMDALGDAIDACTARTATLKELVLALRERVSV